MNKYIFSQILQLNKYVIFETGRDDVILAGIRNYSSMYYVAVLDDAYGDAITSRNIQEFIFDFRTRFSGSKLLLVIFSKDAGSVRTELGEMYGYWIYDTSDDRLIIYDDQPQSFLNLEDIINGADDSGIKPGKYRNSTAVSQIPLMNYLMVAINVIVFIITMFKGDVTKASFLARAGGMVPAYVTEGKEYYRLFTSMFLHRGISHIVSNMIVLFFMGEYLERYVGKVRYIIIYLVSGLAGSFAALFYYNYIGEQYVCCIGASGAVFGVAGALAYILLVNKGRMENLSFSRIIFFIIFNIYIGVRSEGTCNAAHIGGVIAGFLITVICYRRERTSI